jgi:hypothetical protein
MASFLKKSRTRRNTTRRNTLKKLHDYEIEYQKCIEYSSVLEDKYKLLEKENIELKNDLELLNRSNSELLAIIRALKKKHIKSRKSVKPAVSPKKS